jgi:hypothetical protein
MFEKKNVVGVVVNKFGDTVIIKEESDDSPKPHSYTVKGEFKMNDRVTFDIEGYKALNVKLTGQPETTKVVTRIVPSAPEEEEEEIVIDMPSSRKHHEDAEEALARKAEANTCGSAGPHKSYKKHHSNRASLKEEMRANYEEW